MAEFLLFGGAFPLRAALLQLGGMNVSGVRLFSTSASWQVTWHFLR